jgi:hypothetical protein
VGGGGERLIGFDLETIYVEALEVDLQNFWRNLPAVIIH